MNVTATDKSPQTLAGFLEWSFVVDDRPPETAVRCTASFPTTCLAGAGRSNLLRPDSTITLEATDGAAPASGVASLRWSLMRAATVLATSQDARSTTVIGLRDIPAIRDPLPSERQGNYTLEFFATDNATNRESPAKVLEFFLDERGPTVRQPVRTSTAAGWNVSVHVEDPQGGVREVRVHWRHGLFGNFQTLHLAPPARADGSGIWTGELPGAPKGTVVQYWIEAFDNLGNAGTFRTSTQPETFSSENHRPDVAILSPRNGDVVSGTVTLTWSVRDLDNDPVQLSIGALPASEVGTGVPFSMRRIPSLAQAQRELDYDVSGLANGVWAINLTAEDGDVENNRTSVLVHVRVENPVENVTLSLRDLGRSAPGGETVLSARVNRLVTLVEAKVYREGAGAAERPLVLNLTDDGVPPDEHAGDLLYTGSVRVEQEGRYRADLLVLYDDGTQQQVPGAWTFEVTRFGDPISGNLALWALAALLAAAVVGVSATVWRRR